MHTIYLRIDEDLDEGGMRTLQDNMRGVSHVTDVEVDACTPHNMLIEFEEEFPLRPEHLSAAPLRESASAPRPDRSGSSSLRVARAMRPAPPSGPRP